MPNPTTGILDNFNRADESPLSNGGQWTAAPFGAGDPLRLVSNEADNVVAAGTLTGDQKWGTSFNADQEVFVSLGTLATTDERGVSVAARIKDPGVATFDAYVLQAFIQVPAVAGQPLPLMHVGGAGYNCELSLISFTNGVRDVPDLANATIEVASGDRIWLKCQGTTLTAYHAEGAADFTEIFNVTDSLLTGAGSIGLRIRGQEATADDFGGGNL